MEMSENSSQKGIVIEGGGDTGGGRGVALFAVLVGVLLVINIVLSAVVLGRPAAASINVNSGPGGSGQAPAPPPPPVYTGGPGVGKGGDPPGKIWMLQYGHDYGAYEYIDDRGYHQGFFRDLVKAVCAAASVNCRMVFDKYSNCWDSSPAKQPILGTGLQARYYDACIGWSPTVERIHAASFSLPFLHTVSASFFHLTSTAFDVNDLSNVKIGFIDGWAANEKCVARNFNNTKGAVLKEDKIKYYPDPKALMTAVRAKEVDAAFAVQTEMETYLADDLAQTDTGKAPCTLAGDAVISRMDNNFPAIWNRGFNYIRANGEFKKLCEDGADKHGERGPLECVESFGYNNQ